MKSIKLLHEAETELWEAASYYEEQHPGLGIDFVQEVRTAFRFIEKSPEMWPAKARGLRRYLIERFPFSVNYRVESDRVLVIAIAHGRRKPGYWKERL